MKEMLHEIIREIQSRKRRGEEFIPVLESTLREMEDVLQEKFSTNKPFVGRAEPLPPSPVACATAPSLQTTDRADMIPQKKNSVSGSFLEIFGAQAAPPKPPMKASRTASSPPSAVGIPAPRYFEIPEGDKETSWKAMRALVLACPVCNSHVKPGCQVVFGTGNLDADIFFCGEAPGADEEREGIPFVGKAGELLTKMIQAMGLSRDDVYIGNIMNWRPEMPTPTGNRPPTPEEMAFCLPYLQAQVRIVQPKVIVALGATAAKGLLGQDAFKTLREIRGQWCRYEETPVMVTYHPSYLLRYSTKVTKRQAWEDMLAVLERVGLPVSERQKSFFQ